MEQDTEPEDIQVQDQPINYASAGEIKITLTVEFQGEVKTFSKTVENNNHGIPFNVGYIVGTMEVEELEEAYPLLDKDADAYPEYDESDFPS